MATIYKRVRRKPIPKGAKLWTFRGKQVAEWTDGRGEKQRAPVSEDGAAVLLESQLYTVEYFDHEGRRRRKGLINPWQHFWQHSPPTGGKQNRGFDGDTTETPDPERVYKCGGQGSRTLNRQAGT